MEDPVGRATDSSTNPYAPPASHTTEVIIPTKVDSRNIMVAWESMRLRYNLILLLPGLIVIIIYVAGVGLPFGVALIGSAMTALAANACYLLGALSEIIVSALVKTSEHPGYRKTTYYAGIAFSLVFFALVCLPIVIFSF